MPQTPINAPVCILIGIMLAQSASGSQAHVHAATRPMHLPLQLEASAALGVLRALADAQAMLPHTIKSVPKRFRNKGMGCSRLDSWTPECLKGIRPALEYNPNWLQKANNNVPVDCVEDSAQVSPHQHRGVERVSPICSSPRLSDDLGTTLLHPPNSARRLRCGKVSPSV